MLAIQVYNMEVGKIFEVESYEQAAEILCDLINGTHLRTTETDLMGYRDTFLNGGIVHIEEDQDNVYSYGLYSVG